MTLQSCADATSLMATTRSQVSGEGITLHTRLLGGLFYSANPQTKNSDGKTAFLWKGARVTGGIMLIDPDVLTTATGTNSMEISRS